MRRSLAPTRTTARLFALYAVVSALPVIALALVLATNFRAQARQRALDQGRTEAAIAAQTAVEPLLDGRPLSEGLDRHESAGLMNLSDNSIRSQILRLRLRDLSGRIVYGTDDPSPEMKPDPGALAAAHGHVVAQLTHLNGDDDEEDGAVVDDVAAAGGEGPKVVEIYMPLRSATSTGRTRLVGVLELYLPYAPIARETSRLLSTLYRDLFLGLGALYLALLAITISVSNRLRRATIRSTYLAEHDALTDLPNRSSFTVRGDAVVARAIRAGRTAAVAIVDVDNFQSINDTLGHDCGDTMLRELAVRLSHELAADGHVARLGGDEFGIVLTDGTAAPETLWRVRAALHREVMVAGLPLPAQVSIGWALAPEDGSDLETLLQRADVAMHAAKRGAAGVQRYDASLHRHDAASLHLAAELPHAIADDQLVLHYQPLEHLAGGRVVALEALVRWQHPVHGLLFPDRFLALAEQTDVIEQLTAWVLRRALHDVIALDPDLRVAVNVAARSIGSGRLADEVLSALAERTLDPGRLIIEVTETTILADPASAVRELDRLARAGVSISLDDFGQGQTSIGHLSGLPLRELKLDRAFVGDMDTDAAHAAIVHAMVELGHNLGLQVVAEGVETDAVAGMLADSGADLIQGYLLSKPLPLAEIATWLAERRPPVVA